ncbi:prolipoprotein diacylglyceryl transferase [Mycolicibacterium hodleri]|uniref:Phosphatidylglycerol--prolipoprotein diacylglyceryl transferase n=1 Tax=Mycolicibacterium hodleri TaxID=49897 RepID=A0A502E6P4_9MYCO|nr:prolipoprotein diacylglyceryl transferase [Mycolicibacterium hodleri]TPG32216.1 prolipoprotein diacylglyceryl transferase [Mycolicibacterium hodleri]
MTTTVLAFIPSPSQGVWHLGFVPIRAYALCIIAGIVAALVIGDRRWEARGGERGVIYDVALWAVPFGLIGGRLYHVMTDWQKYFGADGAGFAAALRIWDGGLGIWGAVALGGVGAWIACRRRGIPLPAFGDAIAPGIVLAQAIGRLGNYFNQELYGRVTDLPWGLTIYDRLDPSGVVSPHSLDGVSTGQVYAVVHPTFLYELLWNLLIFAVLIWADRRFKLGHGRLFALYVAGYCVGRFWVELMRSDTATLIAGIRVNTFTSTFVFIGAVIYIMVAPKGREDPTTLRGNAADESLFDELGEELVAVAATSGVVAAAKVAGDEDTAQTPTGTESEAAAESEGLTEQVETAPSEDVGAAAGAEADEPKAALGAVEGDDAVAAEEAAPEVDVAALDGAEEADAVAADVAGEPEVTEPDAAEESTATPEGGLGSVEGEEVHAAGADVAEVHEAAVDGKASAEAAADDVVAEPEVGEESAGESGSVEGEEVEAAEAPVEESTATPEGGLGSVEGEEVHAAGADVAEVHEAAVDGKASAEAAADDVATEPEVGEESAGESGSVEGEEVEAAEAPVEESTATPEGGLGSVEGEEVHAAGADVAKVHEAAVDGKASAEAAADDVVAEPEVGEESAGESGSVEGEEVEAAEAPVEESTATPEGGLGSVEGEEVEAAEARVEESTATPEGGLGSAEGAEVHAAGADVAEVHEAAVEGKASAEAAADDLATEKPSAAPARPFRTTRRRWWRRN